MGMGPVFRNGLIKISTSVPILRSGAAIEGAYRRSHFLPNYQAQDHQEKELVRQ